MDKGMKVTEISIPVPWGIIAGKAWGDELATPMLCVHGVLDNCDALNQLIPLLPRSFFYLCIDLPGHGKSSHFPNGLVIDVTMFVLTIKRVVDYFKWNKVRYLGHSFGGVVGLFFACLFPEHIDKLVLIDPFLPKIIRNEETVEELRDSFAKIYDIEKRIRNSKPPLYTIDDLIDKMMKIRGTGMTYEAARVFVERSLEKVNNKKYIFTTDQRLKVTPRLILNHRQIEEILSNAKCPMLYIEAKILRNEILMSYEKSTFYKDFLLKKKNVKFYIVDGNHDVHLLHPERLNKVIGLFLLEENSNL